MVWIKRGEQTHGTTSSDEGGGLGPQERPGGTQEGVEKGAAEEQLKARWAQHEWHAEDAEDEQQSARCDDEETSPMPMSSKTTKMLAIVRKSFFIRGYSPQRVPIHSLIEGRERSYRTAPRSPGFQRSASMGAIGRLAPLRVWPWWSRY